VVDLFEGFVGNHSVTALLRDEAAQPSHAYLFVGPGSVGKATAARHFAAALLCDDDDVSCRRRVIGATHPDLVLIEPEGRASITVDQARQAVSQASLAPMEGNRKLFLFEEGGMMNDEAANALLKTLEEPSDSTIFIVVAESESDLPETIASRCRTVVFGRVEDEALRTGLESIGIEPEQAEQATRISGGRPGLALALATRPEVAEYRRVWLSVPLRLPEHPGDAFVLADEVMAASEPLLAALRERQQAEAAEAAAHGGGGRVLKDRHEREMRRASSALYVSGLEILAGFYRDAAAAQFGAPIRNPDIPASALTKVRPAVAAANIERIMTAIESLQANQRPALAFAALFADLGAPA
jgi:DNA polymerase-3 subunit delta'